MAKAKKLPSGSWRCLVYSHTEKVLDKKTGQLKDKRIYESFTSSIPGPAGKRDAELQAAKFAAEKEKRTTITQAAMTFGEAADKYIAGRESILSAGTIREYKRLKNVDLIEFEDVKLNKITPQEIQIFINRKAQEKKSPKTIRNIHGLISSVLKAYRPDLALNTALPQKISPQFYIPTDEDIQKLMGHINNEDMMIAVLLAAFGPLRRSEICGLEDTDFNGNIAHIQRAVVLNEHKQWVDKTTKTVAGNRYVPFPDFVIDKIRDRKGRIIHLKPNQISDRFIDIVKASGLPHFRFHDLRHYSASIQHAIGIPDAYIMQRGGWKSDTVLKQVYRHALSDKSKDMNEKVNNYFSGVCNTKYNIEKENP